jgi:hypothetical protein
MLAKALMAGGVFIAAVIASVLEHQQSPASVIDGMV